MYDFGFNAWSFISTIANVVLGGGFIISLITLKQQKQRSQGEADQAAAQADSTELDNVEKAIRIWREMAESLENELRETRAKSEKMSEKMAEEISQLRREVCRLAASNRKMIEMLNKITPENLERMIEKIKDEFQNDYNEEISQKSLAQRKTAISKG